MLHAAAQPGGLVVPARAQMATTLGFRLILACLGIALPSIVLLARVHRPVVRDEVAMRLARRWSQAMGVLIAVGVVTGTVLSSEMGLLWPGPDTSLWGGAGVPVRRGGHFLLPGGDLRRNLPVGLAAAARLGALVERDADRVAPVTLEQRNPLAHKHDAPTCASPGAADNASAASRSASI